MPKKKNFPFLHQARNGLIVMWTGDKIIGIKPISLRIMRQEIESMGYTKPKRERLFKELEQLTKLESAPIVKIQPYDRERSYNPGDKVVGPDGSVHILDKNGRWKKLI